MGYKDDIKILANTDMTEIQRMEQIVRDMAKTIDTIMGYKYTIDNYKGDSAEIIQNEVNKVKKSLVVLMSDIDILVRKLAFDLQPLMEKRIEKIIKRVVG